MATVTEPIGVKSRMKYRFSEWLDGQAWILKKGIDFDLPLERFRIYVYAVAKQRETKVITKLVDSETLIVQSVH